MTRFSLLIALSMLSALACSDTPEDQANQDTAPTPERVEPTSDATSNASDDIFVASDLGPGEPAVEDASTAQEPDTPERVADEEDVAERVADEEDVARGPAEEVVEEATPVSDPHVLGPLSFEASTHTEPLDAGSQSADVFMVIYTPEGDGPFPTVVFTHGFQLAPADYATYGEHLASWGYMAILPQLPGGLFDGPNHVELKGYLKALVDWIDAEAPKADGPLQGKADADSLGLSGHSMGGKISLLLASEDTRPLAVFGVDPVDAAGGPFDTDPSEFPSVTPELMDQILAPLALIGETTNGQGAGGFAPACAPEEDNFHQYYVHATSPAIEVEILGASHMSFLDDPNCGLACFACPTGSDDPAQTRALTQGYMIAFFNLFLRSEEGYRTYLAGEEMDGDIAAGLVSSETKNNF